jgi:hypothetical protein
MHRDIISEKFKLIFNVKILIDLKQNKQTSEVNNKM